MAALQQRVLMGSAGAARGVTSRAPPSADPPRPALAGSARARPLGKSVSLRLSPAAAARGSGPPSPSSPGRRDVRANMMEGAADLVGMVGQSAEMMESMGPEAALETFALSLTTFNILAPIYRRMGADGEKRESDNEDMYMTRNRRIMDMLLNKQSSIICLQEFWFQNDKLQALYNKALDLAGYEIFGTPRTNNRGDGLLTAVSRKAFTVVDKQDVAFNDCGDRVAMLLRLRPTGGTDTSDVILVNTHLLFPHNANSTLIRLRQVFKMLEFLESYKTSNDIGAVPIVMCGDWNGTKTGQVARFMRSQGFTSTYDEAGALGDADKWASHLNHHGEKVGVDFIWLLNPSQQRQRPSLTADWRRAVFAMIESKLAERGCSTNAEAFNFIAGEECGESGGEAGGAKAPRPAKVVNEHGECAISIEAFRMAVDELGLTGEGSIGLVSSEIDELVATADRDGNGMIDYFEFCRLFDVPSMRATYEAVKDTQGIVEGEWGHFSTAAAVDYCLWPVEEGCKVVDGNIVCEGSGDLVVESSELPETMASGGFPKEFVDELSDHAPLTSVLRGLVSGGSRGPGPQGGAEAKLSVASEVAKHSRSLSLPLPPSARPRPTRQLEQLHSTPTRHAIQHSKMPMAIPTFAAPRALIFSSSPAGSRASLPAKPCAPMVGVTRDLDARASPVYCLSSRRGSLAACAPPAGLFEDDDSKTKQASDKTDDHQDFDDLRNSGLLR